MFSMFMGTRLGKFLGVLVVALGIILGVYQSGRRDQRKATKAKNLEQYVKKQKEVNDVEAAPTRDDAIKRLRDNGWTR